jgi:hypothetical protein
VSAGGGGRIIVWDAEHGNQIEIFPTSAKISLAKTS